MEIRYSLKFRIFQTIIFSGLALSLQVIAVVLMIEEGFRDNPFFISGLLLVSVVCIVNAFYINNARLEFDDEKLIDVCFNKRTVIYYKNIVLFGMKNGLPKRPTYQSYWIIKTKDKVFQPEMQLSTDNSAFEQLLNAMKTANPDIKFDFGKSEYRTYNN